MADAQPGCGRLILFPFSTFTWFSLCRDKLFMANDLREHREPHHLSNV